GAGRPAGSARPRSECGRCARGAGAAGCAGSWSASSASAPVTESGDTEIEHGAAHTPLRSTVSPQPLALDGRSGDTRDMPSRTDVLVGSLSQVIGGPVGRHALIGRTRFM